jgi:uncharacterized membrane protein
MFVVAYAFLYALALIQLGVSADALPDRMATHFVSGGTPKGFMHKDSFIIFYLGFMFFVPGVIFAASALIERLPGSVNIPNKDYWMAADRRDAAIKSLARGFRVLGLLIGLLLIGIDQLVINANLVKPPKLDEQGIWVFLGVFVFCFIGFLGWMTTRFRIPGKDQ